MVSLSNEDARLIDMIVQRDKAFFKEMHGRQKKEVQAQKQNPCEAPEVGRILELISYEELMYILDLDEETYQELYNELPPQFASDKQGLKVFVKTHLLKCRRCRLINDNRLWLSRRVNEIVKGDAGGLSKIQDAHGKSGKRAGISIVWMGLAATLALALILAISITLINHKNSRKPENNQGQNDVPSQAPLGGQESGSVKNLATQQFNNNSRNPLPVIAKASHKIVLDDEEARDSEGGASKKEPIQIPASRTERTALTFRLPERSKKGLYVVTIGDAFLNPLVRERAASLDGKTLRVELDLRKLTGNGYYLIISREKESPSIYPVLITGLSHKTSRGEIPTK